MLLEQSPKAKHDVAAIRPYVIGYQCTGGQYGRNTYEAQLCSVPLDDFSGEWTPERVGRALVDYCDGGWSPFGGYAKPISIADLRWNVSVYID